MKRLQWSLLAALYTVLPLNIHQTMPRWFLWLGVLVTPALTDTDDSPLFLTPILEAGDAARARDLAAVPPLLPDCCESFAGFFTVNKEYDSNMFFWFFPSQTRRDSAPLVVWLQGGPGTSLMRPVLLENGPYQLELERPGIGIRIRRGGDWTRSHSVLYFDNPVGTGYSFTCDEAGYSRTDLDIAANLHEALDQFFTMFPGERSRDLYIAGESYGGKMAVSLAHHIHSRGSGMRLRGLLVINGLLELESQLDKSELAYQLGIVDEAGRDEMKAIYQKQVELIQEGDVAAAFELSLDECGSAVSPADTGLKALSNLLLYNGTQDYEFSQFAELERTREALHVGAVPFKGRAGAVSSVLLRTDATTSVLPRLAELADQGTYRVLVANGQLDLCMPYRLTESLLRKMEWRGAEEWQTSSRRVTWCYRGQLAGYARTVRNVTHVLVRNAGHYLPQDQPQWAADMLLRLTCGATFATCDLCSP